jgi:exopolyphosphatase/guanosine-5'-triphosphate,3'-diphosphate pyrophosphatase
MEPSNTLPGNKAIQKPETAAGARTVAAIDIGANAMRMAIAQVLPDGHVEIIERLQRAVRLGQDTFRRGRLGAQSMRAAVAVLRDYRTLLDLYKVERVRAVTTSAVREAVNADNFLDRIFMATGLNVEVIATSEESRLTVSAVHQALGDALGIGHGATLIVDVGGGSTLLTLLDNGEVTNSLALRLGSIRLQEMLSTSEEPPQRSAELLHHYIGSVVTSAQRSVSLQGIRSFVAVGGDARFAAREAGHPTASTELYTVSQDDFDKLVRRCVRHTPEELAKRFGLPFAEAETLNPALLVYQYLLHLTDTEQMLVSRVSMRDGLVLELARSVTGEEDPAMLEGIIHSAMALAEKYKVDFEHSQIVADLAVRLFDELHADHGLGARQRLLLRVAALLHEVGGYVSNLAHHKHSYYLINNSEIFGLNRTEVQIVAHIARYHRRSVPKLTHLDYMALPREARVTINKLAAILRVADALARGHIKQPNVLSFERQGDEFVVHVSSQIDFMLEQRALAAKGDMFEDVYGMRLRLEES